MAVDWEGVRDEVVGHLQALLRIDTVSPPGNESAAAAYLAEVAREAGIPHELAGAAPGRDNVVARLAGSGAGRPVMLLGHTDVVGVERAAPDRRPLAPRACRASGGPAARRRAPRRGGRTSAAGAVRQRGRRVPVVDGDRVTGAR